ncbi:membrane-associated tyrosine- and threonine-specific cdc2-inhibitory kinase [Phlebotomus argentipes]|uniref:membrane-associated tyrosine- and threonine-specific cdc2-inhibitory kinase n=1 Tax=Phlebotomus argentipes TaxID=94469 RepID=UPI002892C4BF|nr:membrane-associated tyrosine- and threonine-specific cdc2-inhibitory kinase [Phlebotomus argentipes]
MTSEFNKSTLPVPDISDEFSHSFKSQRASSRKKPPALKRIYCNINRCSSKRALAISFKGSLENAQLSFMYEPEKTESYFDQCFERISKIGEGSFGEVFKVRSREDGLLYAVKKSKQYFRSESYREERLKEVRRHEEFSSHEHCVTLHKAWEERDRLYIQMELCQSSLETYVMKQCQIPESLTWSFLLDLLLALKGLHDGNLIHLDIKLENILITEDEVCKLGDFGLVFDLNHENKESAMEGDSRYIAPELLQGIFTKAADIFSLGITILELACNLELPSNGVLWQQLRAGILPKESKCMLSKELYSVIKWMMNPDWQQRPSVDALLRYPRVANLLTKRTRWWSITKIRKVKRMTLQQLSNKWHNFKKTFRLLVTQISFAMLSCVRRKHKNEYEQHNSTSPLEMSDDDQHISTPILDDSSINMSEVVNSTPILSYDKRKARLANDSPHSPQSNSGFEEFKNHLSRSPSSFTPRSTHEYSSLTCKKLFMHSDDSD